MAPNRTATPAKHSTRSTNKTNGHSTDSEDATSFQIKADPEASSEEPDEEELYDDTEDEDRETAGFISKESLPIPGKAGRTLAELNRKCSLIIP